VNFFNNHFQLFASIGAAILVILMIISAIVVFWLYKTHYNSNTWLIDHHRIRTMDQSPRENKTTSSKHEIDSKSVGKNSHNKYCNCNIFVYFKERNFIFQQLRAPVQVFSTQNTIWRPFSSWQKWTAMFRFYWNRFSWDQQNIGRKRAKIIWIGPGNRIFLK